MERKSYSRLDALTGSTRVMYVFNRIVRFGLSRTSGPKYAVAALLRSPFPIVDCFQATQFELMLLPLEYKLTDTNRLPRILI